MNIFKKEKEEKKDSERLVENAGGPHWASSFGDFGYAGERSPGTVAGFSK